MKPAGVHHVAICVADARKGLAFYRDVLGMTAPIGKVSQAASFSVPGGAFGKPGFCFSM